ncbi:acetoacetate decarboxylase [Nocardioides sp. AX2bis]|uniref:acetoacetate decarboxylase n=1 Tax=Nocardioides sp. AX2bis TaxID=2653157 RepID=UPI0012F2252C|nr:acetoacetate decarboxylase [Nocardioides sp. AX2bis]VXB20026.1 Acetoacetate decarboxylase [Nocardioides sp. AX2bis]
MSSAPDGPPYPDAPWHLHGSMWVSLFWLPRAAEGAGGVRPRGLWGAAWVDYADPSPLTYRELLVARPVRRGAAVRVEITDIWVDSPASRDGGRALWAIPKGLGTFTTPASPTGGTWSAEVGAVPTASTTVAERGRGGPRVPLRFTTDQPAVPETDGPRVTPVSGSARVRPLRARWQLGPDGPLSWLAAARPLGSVRLEAFRLRFG